MMNPIDPIGVIQDTLLSRLKAAFTGSDNRSALKAVDAIEVPFDGSTDRKIKIVPPAIYLTPLVVNPGRTQGALIVRWAAYCVASAATTKGRTQGTATHFGLGAYAIATRAALVLDDWTPSIDGASRLELGGIENLTGMAMREKHLHVWAVTLDGEVCTALQNEVDGGINGDDLADFRIFHADFDIPPLEAAPDELPADRDASLTQELPQ